MGQNHPKETSREVVGLIPAAGQATRIAPLPCSKELYPIGFRSIGSDQSIHPKVVCHYLLEKMKLAGVNRVFIVLRSGKWDIPAYFGDGKSLELNLAYLMMGLPFGPPYTLDQAYLFVEKNIVAFGFPDILFQPDDVFVQLLDRQGSTEADVVLGLFSAHDPAQMDMVDICDNGQIREMFLKPLKTDLRYAWVCAVWTPMFTQFMHEYLDSMFKTPQSHDVSTNRPIQTELSVGAVIQVAIQQGLRVDGVPFTAGTYLDIGTPEGLQKACQTGFST